MELHLNIMKTLNKRFPRGYLWSNKMYFIFIFLGKNNIYVEWELVEI